MIWYGSVMTIGSTKAFVVVLEDGFFSIQGFASVEEAREAAKNDPLKCLVVRGRDEIEELVVEDYS